VPSTVQLVGVATGRVALLYQDFETSAYLVEFADEAVTLRSGEDTLTFDMDGTLISRARSEPSADQSCAPVGPGGSIVCGSLSPDRRWFTYAVDAGEYTHPSGYTVPVWDQWVANLETGDNRLMQEGLIHCGGCDGRYGPRWSPSSRFVVFSEFGGDGRRWLSDVVPGVTIEIGAGFEITQAPAWAPTGDLLLYSTPAGGTVLRDPVNDTIRAFPIDWPAAFDVTGTFAYSPAWLYHIGPEKDPDAPKPSTTIVDVTSGEVVERLSGAAPYTFLWTGDMAVAHTGAGLLAVLQGASGCDGTAIYLDGELSRCIEGGVEGQIGPGGLIAVARKTGTTGQIEGPWGGSIAGGSFAIDIVHLDGSAATVVRDAVSLDAAPMMKWNEAGTHLLIQWPRFVGL
jgi:hypothetical protein